MKKNGLFSKIKLLQVTLVSASMILLMAFAPIQQNSEEGWTLLKSQDNVNVFGMITNCDNQSIYLFKVENLNRQSASLSLTITAPSEMAYGPKVFQVVLDPNEETSSLCHETTLRLPRYDLTGSPISEVKVNVTLK